MKASILEKTSGFAADKKSWWKPLGSTVLNFFDDKPYLISLLIALFLSGLILSVFRVYFQLNDDYWALFLLKGTVLNWAPSELNYLENVLFCLGIKNLYIRYPGVEWYSLFFIASQVLSLWAVLAAFQLGSNRFFKTGVFILASAAVEIHFFDCLQWTMVAAMAAIGAILLLTAVWRRGDWEFLPLALILALVLMAISVLVRYQSTLLMGLVFAPAGIHLIWKEKPNPVRWVILVFLVLMAILSIAAVIFDHDYYSQNPVWKESTEIFEQQNDLIDFRHPVYDKTTKPVFDTIRWSANDFNLFMSHYFMDKDTYSSWKLKTLIDYFPQFAWGKDAQDSFEAMFLNLRTPLALLFFLALLPFLLEDFGWVIAIGGWMVMVLIFCYLYLKIPERIYLPCLFLMNTLAIFFSRPETGSSTESSKGNQQIFKLGAVYLSLIFLFVVYLVHLEYVRNGNWTLKAAELKISIEKLNPKDNQLFVTWGSTFPYEKIGAFDTGYLEHFHVVSLAWFQRSPTTQAMMDRFGLRNLFRDMVENRKVFLVCTPKQFNFYYYYMLEKFRMKTYGRAVFRSNPFNVYAIHRVRE